MHNEYIQHIRYKLQRRFRRLNSVSHNNFYSALQHTWEFVHGIPQIRGILETLIAENKETEGEVDKLLLNASGRGVMTYENESEHAAFCYFTIKKCVADSDGSLIRTIARHLSSGSTHNEHIEAFRESFVEPLYDYIDEHLDDTGAILSLLIKYKHSCEWFQNKKLYGLWEHDTKLGEKLLALHLYEFLHNHDINFAIEPTSADGKADLVAEQIGEEKLVADAKIFNPDKGKAKAYILQAIQQAYTYTQNYNESIGYLAIFNTSEQDLRLSLSGCAQSVPYVVLNNKTIFLVVIDIFPHAAPASKRKGGKHIEITTSEIVKEITDDKDYMAA